MIANVDEIKEIKADHAILGERKYSKVLEKYGDEMTALQVSLISSTFAIIPISCNNALYISNATSNSLNLFISTTSAYILIESD